MAAGPSAIQVELDAQYRQLREECGLLDRSGRGKLLVTGPDAAEFLQGQLTNDVEGLGPGVGCYAALLDRKGHLRADMRVLRLARDEIWLDTEVATVEAVHSHLDMYRIGREVEVSDVTDKRGLLTLLGPGAGTAAGIAPPAPDACAELSVAGLPCLAVGTGEGLDLIAGAGERPRLEEALLAAGAARVSEEAAEILRVESGIPRFGAEMGPETMPAEAGIVERAISFTKGCYIGQEPVARLHYRGRPNRTLRGLRLSGPASAGEPLRLGEKEVGRVGTACVSPALGPIGLAIIRREADTGAEVEVGEDGVTGRVINLPFR